MQHLPIKIPPDFEVVVKIEDKVKAGDVLAQKINPPSDVMIDAAGRFGISPKNIKSLLKKSPGDYVEKGEVLATKEGFFTDKKLVSEVRGTFAKYDGETGTVIIRLADEAEDTGDKDILSPLDGKVLMCDNDQIVLTTDKNVLVAEKGTGGAFRGLLMILEKKSDQQAEAEEIAGDAIGKVLFAPKFSREALAKASAIGVGGLLSLELIDTDVEYLSEKRLNIPVLEVSGEIGLRVAKQAGKEIFIHGGNKAILLLSYEKNSS